MKKNGVNNFCRLMALTCAGALLALPASARSRSGGSAVFNPGENAPPPPAESGVGPVVPVAVIDLSSSRQNRIIRSGQTTTATAANAAAGGHAPTGNGAPNGGPSAGGSGSGSGGTSLPRTDGTTTTAPTLVATHEIENAITVISGDSTALPLGDLGPVNAEGAVSGWAAWRANGSALNVHFYIDGVFAGNAVTVAPLADVNAFLGWDARNSAFVFHIPSLYRDGRSHQLMAYVLDPLNRGANPELAHAPREFKLGTLRSPASSGPAPATPAPATPSPTAPPATEDASTVIAGDTSSVPLGDLGPVAADGTVGGWAAWPANGSSLNVHFYVDGTFAGSTTTTTPRPDVNTFLGWDARNSDFRFTIPERFRDGRPRQLMAYVLDPLSRGANPQLSHAPRPFQLGSAPPATATVPKEQHFTFVPNQLRSNPWVRIDGDLVNGHLEESFFKHNLWSNLMALLRRNAGGFGLYASEVGHAKKADLDALRTAGIAVSVDLPSWTQCMPVNEIADLELHGKNPAGKDYFALPFLTPPGMAGRHDPRDGGWFMTKDGQIFKPDEIAYDERMPNLVPRIASEANFQALGQAGLSWEERKTRIFTDSCPQVASFRPGVSRTDALIADYVDFGRALRAKWPNETPGVAIHWNVNPGWEWADEACVRDRYANNSNAAAVKEDIQYLRNACHNDTKHLQKLVKALCDDGACPSAVYMDVDFIYNTAYSLEVLRRNKAVLNSLGVGFGINITEQCGWGVNCVITPSADGNSLFSDRNVGGDKNANFQKTAVNIARFMRLKGIIDDNTKVRLAAWGNIPKERGDEVAETRPGSMAETALKVFRDELAGNGIGNE